LNTQALRRNITSIASLGTSGGEYLTQQLAKQLFHGEGSKFLPFRIVQKVKEWIIAIRLERQYTKNEILAMYCNVYDFELFCGVSSANLFFKRTKNLIEESAILVGMFKIHFKSGTKSKTGEMWYLLRWRKEILLQKRKRDSQSTNYSD
jgi:penicillin-binding protein 1A